MDHTHIVKTSDLERFSDTRESEGAIPELLYYLIRQSASGSFICRIPYGDSVNQPGWDGLVEFDNGFQEFVPQGRSYWEIGTGENPQKKATEDFGKRTRSLSPADRANSSYVFVTSRSATWPEPKQTKWLQNRQKFGWKKIRIIDAVKLADWVREFPAIGRWLAKKVGLTRSLGGISTPREHWEIIVAQTPPGDPTIPPKAFTVGRSAACDALKAIFEGGARRLIFFAESPSDVSDFVSAYIASLEETIGKDFANRCLFVSEEDAWRSVAEARQPHVLVADTRLQLETEERADLQVIATRRGHGVVIPICGAWAEGGPEIVKLHSPSREQLESVFREAGYPDHRARELAAIGGDRISSLRRFLHGFGALPPYGTWESARLLAQLTLAGKWNGKNPGDKQALESLLGKSYGEWIETARSETLRSDTPLLSTDEKWRFVARGESWNALGNRIYDEDLDRFQDLIVQVLGERHPMFDLPKKDRFAAAIHGKELSYSKSLRNGLAETLALIGCRAGSLSSCSVGKANHTAVMAVRRLFENAPWDLWASLDRLLPLIAEAAPDEFLDSVEAALGDLSDTPFHRLYKEEGSGGVGGWNYMSGILWALETLAWHPHLLTRVSVILADLASFDPGGNWSNRPANSLTNIFLPWHPQTCATIEKRKAAVSTVIREHPDVGWKLVLSLLPHNYGATSGCQKPVWRDYIPREWDEKVPLSDYFEQTRNYVDLAFALANGDIDRIGELLKRFQDLPPTSQDSLLQHLSNIQKDSLSEMNRVALWEQLDGMLRKHRRYCDAKWALPETILERIERVALLLKPLSPELAHRHLFNSPEFELYEENGDWEKQRRTVARKKEDAVQGIFEKHGFQGILSFSKSVSEPYDVGLSLGRGTYDGPLSDFFPDILESNNIIFQRLLSGFICARFWRDKWDWADRVLSMGLSIAQKAQFLSKLPFVKEVWTRVALELGPEHERCYWTQCQPISFYESTDENFAIEKLINFGRPAAGMNIVSYAIQGSSPFPAHLALKAFESIIRFPESVEDLDHYMTVEVIKKLQQEPNVDQDILFKIEWFFLRWLDRFSSATPLTLERRLASDPKFFAEVVSLVFRSKNEKDQKAEISDSKRAMAENAYHLLTEWRLCPGTNDKGEFSETDFSSWLEEVKKITQSTGHFEVAQIQIGHVLVNAPPDPDGLWIHCAVANALNGRDTAQMRSGYSTALFNQRGVFTFTAGKEERELAEKFRAKAEALDSHGFSRIATTLREIADHYDRDAERESKRRMHEEV